MDYRIIARIIGLLLLLFAGIQILPITTAVLYGERVVFAFLTTGIGSFVCGMCFWLVGYKHHGTVRYKEGLFIAVLFWCMLSLVSTVPFLIALPTISFIDALFEAVSGLTTTGATILTGIDNLPRAVQLYRQELQWLGGMGIVVLAVAVLPMLGIGGNVLYSAETARSPKDTKLTPRITETAKALWFVYFGLTVLCACAYWLFGMSFFDAVAHSFSTVAIGGFSTHDAGIGYFANPAIEWVSVVFMLLSGMNFALHFSALRSYSLTPYFANAEWRFFCYILLCVTTITVLYLSHTYYVDDLHTALQKGVFQAVSFATTTGFVSDDITAWPIFVPVLLIIVSCIGGCSGSTGGGIKVIRLMVFLKQGLLEIFTVAHPRAVRNNIAGMTVEHQTTQAIWGFLALYVFSLCTVVLLLLFLGIDAETAFSAAAAMLNNLGPGLGTVASGYGNLIDPAKWLLIITMLLGRLEIIAFLALLNRHYWR